MVNNVVLISFLRIYGEVILNILFGRTNSLKQLIWNQKSEWKKMSLPKKIYVLFLKLSLLPVFFFFFFHGNFFFFFFHGNLFSQLD